MRLKSLKVLLGISLLALGGCSNKGEVKTDNIKIGVLQYAEHNALTSAREGFVEALAEEGFTSEKVTFNIQNAMGDQSNLQSIAEQLAKKNDLNFVIATPAAQAMVNVDDKTPTVFTAVTDPVAASLLTKTDAPEGNVTGTVDLTPVDKQIEKLLKIVPKAKKVGIFYNSSEVNSEAQAKIAKETLKKSGIEVAFMLDVSNSMLSEDVRPNRLERAKLLVSTLIDRMQNDKVSLGIFAGDAYPQLPITTDYASAKVFLDAISTDMVTSQGTGLKAAIRLADNSFTKNKNVGKAIVLITDGEDHEGGALEAAQEAAKNGRQIFVLGVGSPEGGHIPTAGGLLRDENGQLVVTHLNESMCRQLAKVTGGQYFHIDNTNNAQTQLQHALNQLQKAPIQDSETTCSEQFQAIGVIVVLLLIMEFFIFDTQNPWIDRWHIFRKK